MDGFGSANSSVSEEEGSDGSEDGVGDSDGAVDCEVKHDVRAQVVGRRESLHSGGEGGPGRVGVGVLRFSRKTGKVQLIDLITFNTYS